MTFCIHEAIKRAIHHNQSSGRADPNRWGETDFWEKTSQEVQKMTLGRKNSGVSK